MQRTIFIQLWNPRISKNPPQNLTFLKKDQKNISVPQRRNNVVFAWVKIELYDTFTSHFSFHSAKSLSELMSVGCWIHCRTCTRDMLATYTDSVLGMMVPGSRVHGQITNPAIFMQNLQKYKNKHTEIVKNSIKFWKHEKLPIF